jgi:Carbohydrate esterase, sialic acid-specific acetylesterase
VKYIIAAIFLFCTLSAFSQTNDTTQYNPKTYGYGWHYNRLWVDSALRFSTMPDTLSKTPFTLKVYNGNLYYVDKYGNYNLLGSATASYSFPYLQLNTQSSSPAPVNNATLVYRDSIGQVAWRNSPAAGGYIRTFGLPTSGFLTANRIYRFQDKSYVVGDSADIAAVKALTLQQVATNGNTYTGQLTAQGYNTTNRYLHFAEDSVLMGGKYNVLGSLTRDYIKIDSAADAITISAYNLTLNTRGNALTIPGLISTYGYFQGTGSSGLFLQNDWGGGYYTQFGVRGSNASNKWYIPTGSGTFADSAIVAGIISGTTNIANAKNADSLGHIVASSYNPIDIFLIGGQSNAVGFSYSTDSLPVPPSGTAYLWQSGGAITPVVSNTIGAMWRPFALEYYRITGRKILFVQSAVGGSSQAYAAQYATGTWDTGGALYGISVGMLDSAITSATNAGYTPKVQGVLWAQGEQDATMLPSGGNTITTTTYYNALAAMVARYRAKYANIPFYIFRTGTRLGTSYTDANASALIRQQQENFSAADTLTKIVFREAYTFTQANGLLRDSVHYSALGYMMAGYNGATEVANGWAKNGYYNAYKPLYDTSGLIIANTNNLYITNKFSSASVLTVQRNNLNAPSFSYDIPSGGITTSNASGLNSSTTLQQQDYSSTSSSAAIHNFDRYGGTVTSPSQLGTGYSVGQIVFRAPNTALSPTALANVTTSTATATVSSGNTIGTLLIQTRGLTDALANRFQVDQTGKVLLGGGAIRGGGFTTGGASYQLGGNSVTDTSITGTVAEVDLGIASANTLTTGNTATVTDLVNFRFTSPTAGAGITATRLWGTKHTGAAWLAGSTSALPSFFIPSGSDPTSNQQSGYVWNNTGVLKFYSTGNRRVALYNDVAPTSSQYLLGNGTDFTVTSITSTPTASTLIAWDANKNLAHNNIVPGYTTTATAGATTALTAASTYLQFFTGTLNQTVTLPSNAAQGMQFYIRNNSSGLITINASGGGLVRIVGAGTRAMVTCLNANGTTAADWSANYLGINITDGKVLSASNSLTISGTDGSTLNIGTGGTLGSAAYVNVNNNFTNSRQDITSGTTATVTTGVRRVYINLASLAATFTLTTATMNDGDMLELFFGGTITAGNPVVTTFTLTPASGSVYGGITLNTAKGGDYAAYVWDATNSLLRRVK